MARDSQGCTAVVTSPSPFPFLVMSSTCNQSCLPMIQSPGRMRRSSLTPLASTATEQRPRHHSVGSGPTDLQVRGAAAQPRLQTTVQVVPCSASPPVPPMSPNHGCSPGRNNPKCPNATGNRSALGTLKINKETHENFSIKLELWCQRFIKPCPVQASFHQ